MFNIGDKVTAFGVEGVVVAISAYNVTCEFLDSQGVKQWCMFSPDGKLFEWANEPSMKKV